MRDNFMHCLQAAHHAAGDKSLVIVADDTDVFALLLHFRQNGSINASSVYLESPLKGRAVIDIDATVQNNFSIIPGLLAAHALTGCDTVASHYGIGKGIVLKVLRAGNICSQCANRSLKHNYVCVYNTIRFKSLIRPYCFLQVV